MSRLQEQGRRMAEAVIEERETSKSNYYLTVDEALAKIRQREAVIAGVFDANPLSDDFMRGVIQGLRVAESFVKRIGDAPVYAREAEDDCPWIQG